MATKRRQPQLPEPLTPQQIRKLMKQAAPGAAELDRKMKRLFRPGPSFSTLRLR